MKLIFKFAIVLAGIILIAGCDQTSTTQNQGKAVEYLTRAESYFQQGQYSAASIEARNAIKEDPTNREAYLLISRILYEQGNHEQSVKALQELPKTDIRVVELLGNNYLKQGKFRSLANLIAEAPKDATSAQSWELAKLEAYAAINQKKAIDIDKQIASLMNLAKKPAQKAASELVRAEYYKSQNQTDKQLLALDKALAYEPNSVDAILEKAKIRYAEKNYEAAEDLLSQALINLPSADSMTLKRVEVLQAMAATLTRQNRTGEAMIYSKLIAEANPKAQELKHEFDMGIEKLKAGNINEAEDIFSKLYLTDHAKVAGSILGMIKFTQGQYEDAAEYFENTIDPETASPEVLRAFAESQLRTKNPQMALQTIEANIQEHPEDGNLLGIYGLALLASGETDKGIANIQKALALDPTRVRLHLALAAAYNAQNNNNAALTELKKAYDTSPEDISIQERLALQYAMMKDGNGLQSFAEGLSKSQSNPSRALAGLIFLQTTPDKGKAYLDELYAESPSDPAILNAQLRKSLQTGDYSQVIRIGKILTNTRPDDIQILGAIVQAYRKQQNLNGALEFLNDLSEKSSNIWGPDYIIALIHLSARDFEKSIASINRATSKSGFNDVTSRLYNRIYFSYASQLAQRGDRDHARSVVMEAMQNNEVNPMFLHLLIKIELADDKLAEAEKLLAELKQTASGTALLNQAMGDVSVKKNDGDAITHYKAAWQMTPSDAVALSIWKLLKDNNTAEQQQFLTDWKNKLPKSFVAPYIEGMQYQTSGKANNAIEAYRKSLAINPNQPVVLNNIAWLLMEKGQFDEALRNGEKAAKLAPESASILDTYGWIAYKAGKKDLAITTLEKALANEPGNHEIQQHLDTVKAK